VLVGQSQQTADGAAVSATISYFLVSCYNPITGQYQPSNRKELSHMSFEISSLEDLEKRLLEMEQAAHDLEGNHFISLEKLFPAPFMEKYSSVSSFGDFLSSGNFKVTCQEDFNSIPDDLLDQHTAQVTCFPDWESMVQQAVSEYATRMLKF